MIYLDEHTEKRKEKNILHNPMELKIKISH